MKLILAIFSIAVLLYTSAYAGHLMKDDGINLWNYVAVIVTFIGSAVYFIYYIFKNMILDYGILLLWCLTPFLIAFYLIANIPTRLGYTVYLGPFFLAIVVSSAFYLIFASRLNKDS